MNKFILSFCIFSNFWGVYILNTYLWHTSGNYIVYPNSYYAESIRELMFVTIAIFFIMYKSPKVERYKVRFVSKIRHVEVLYILYFLFLLMFLSNINITLDNTSRGVDQFELAGRSGLAGLMSVAGTLVLPFILFVMIHKPFGKWNTNMAILLIGIILLSNVTHGGRRWVSYLGLSLFAYYYYIKRSNIRNLVIPALLFFFLMPLSMVLRGNGSITFVSYEQKFITSIFQANSDPSFLWAVKRYMDLGITMSPIDFAFHFLSIFLPSFIFIMLTGQISYNRSVFVFDHLFNDNPNQGYDFMVLADFYWCFGYLGYILFIGFVWLALFLFRKYIYSEKSYLTIFAIVTLVFACQQRNDFGPIVKCVVYCTIFAWLLSKLFVIREKRVLIK